MVRLCLPAPGGPWVHQDAGFPAVPRVGEAAVPGSGRGRSRLAGAACEQARQHQLQRVITLNRNPRPL